jgi:hypothetical protein
MTPESKSTSLLNEILSPTLVKLKDKNTGKLFKNLIHMDRLKIAFVRAPNPTNYFIQEPVVANETEHDVVLSILGCHSEFAGSKYI